MKLISTFLQKITFLTTKNKKNITNIVLLSWCVIILVALFRYINTNYSSSYLLETFTTNSEYGASSTSTSKTVDLPLNTSYSCKNVCGPNARCSVTGQQCMADIDCSGCQPYTSSSQQSTENVPGDNDAGKMSSGVAPQYSSLTSGYGTQERIIIKDFYSKPAMADFGTDIWTAKFKQQIGKFDKKYKPPDDMKYMPKYPERYSLSGRFEEDGPMAANAEFL